MDIFLHNSEIKPANEATASLYSVEFNYGFGVYENIRVKQGAAQYATDHIKRLLQSAEVICLEHTLNESKILEDIERLIQDIDEPAFNLKLLLIGARKPEDVDFYILPLKPKFPDRRLYKTGAKAITIELERYLPNAKTLNMLPSYLAYRTAQEKQAYDAILLNQKNEMVEGTRTNLFRLRGGVLTTPPSNEVLVGVTRTHVMKTATSQGLTIVEAPLPYADISPDDSYFITSTSSKIMPLNYIDKHALSLSPELFDLMNSFSAEW